MRQKVRCCLFQARHLFVFLEEKKRKDIATHSKIVAIYTIYFCNELKMVFLEPRLWMLKVGCCCSNSTNLFSPFQKHDIIFFLVIPHTRHSYRKYGYNPFINGDRLMFSAQRKRRRDLTSCQYHSFSMFIIIKQSLL